MTEVASAEFCIIFVKLSIFVYWMAKKAPGTVAPCFEKILHKQDKDEGANEENLELDGDRQEVEVVWASCAC